MTRDDYRRKLLYGRKRGGHCLVGPVWLPQADGPPLHFGRLCGCGGRTPPAAGHRRRIVRRRLARELAREVGG